MVSLLVAAVAAVAQDRAEDPLPEVRVELVADGLPRGLLVTSPPEDMRRLFVVQQTGQIRIIENGGVAERPFLDLGGQVSDGVEQGLLGLAFHPDYARNGRFFVNYTDRAGDTQVAEYRVSADPAVADPASARPVLTIAQPSPIHNGGHLAFGPDRMLYIGSGDGGPGADPGNVGQRLDTLLGKILRIDVDRTDPGLGYAIPPDNPFRALAGARPEIWAYGLRNPWRFSFDRETGDLWIGDVGELFREEVDLAPAGVGGLNFGWNQYEGSIPFATPAGAYQPPYQFPITDYAHRGRCSVTGGHVYRGTEIPGLRGRYVYGDWCSGEVWSIPAGPVPARTMPVLGIDQKLTALSSFGEDATGELYAVAGPKVFRIVAP